MAPAAFTDPKTIAGWAPDGRTLEGLLYSPAATALALIGGGADAGQAMVTAGAALDQIMHTLMADTSRTAASIDIATRPGVGWVRMVNPPCCAKVHRAGRTVLRWNDGFLRHPRCDCVHQPAQSRAWKVPAAKA